MNDILQITDWSRAQFAMTAIYHWLFVPLTLGLSIIVAIMETIWYRKPDPQMLRTVKFWMRLFGINFAVGVATGIILEFEFGTNWSNYSYFVGDIFGAPLAVEGILAFFLEATFIAVMFWGWGRVSRRFHLAATWLTGIGASISALWILVANSWMQYPVGMTFNPATARNEMTSFWDVLFSPVAVNKFTHAVTSSYALAAVFVIGVCAWFLLRRRESDMVRRSIAVAAPFGLVCALITAFSGDRSGVIMAETQPMKLAATEALYDGREGAPLVVMGIVKPYEPGENAISMCIEIPKLLSVMSFHDAEAYVAGINDLLAGDPGRGIMAVEERMERGRVAIATLAAYRRARNDGDRAAADSLASLFDPGTSAGKAFLADYFAHFGYGYLSSPEEVVPNVPLLFYSFRLMVGWGMVMIALFIAVMWLNRRNMLPRYRWLLWCLIAAVPMTYLASQAGWVVCEVGRQPWAIQNLLPTCAAVSDINPATLIATFFIFLLLFTLLLVVELRIMFTQIARGPEGEETAAEADSNNL